MNFSDSPLYSRLSARTGAGAIDFRRAHSLINRFTLAFFDVYLRNASECELDRAAASFPKLSSAGLTAPGVWRMRVSMSPGKRDRQVLR